MHNVLDINPRYRPQLSPVVIINYHLLTWINSEIIPLYTKTVLYLLECYT